MVNIAVVVLACSTVTSIIASATAVQLKRPNSAFDHGKQAIYYEAVEKIAQTAAILQRTERKCGAFAPFAASSLAAATNDGEDNNIDGNEAAAMPNCPACAMIANCGHQRENA